MAECYRITGPPGTGKTTYVLRQIERLCQDRVVSPEHLGAVSFTKAAVVEMQTRVADVLGVSAKIARNIRTIHSHCFKLMGLSKEQVVDEGSKHILDWNEKNPTWALPTNKIETDDDPSLAYSQKEAEDNYKVFRRMEIMRGAMLSEGQMDKTDSQAFYFYRKWKEWMSQNDLYDYTRMTEEAYNARLCPDIDVLFVDETQDLNRLQIRLMEVWKERCQKVVWVGDEDQCLYRFSGASPEDFRNLARTWSNVLSKSYRVPQMVHEYAMRLIRQISDREDVDYLPTDQVGRVERVYFPDLTLPGSHMILVRCNYQIKRWVNFLTEKGVAFHNPYKGFLGWNPADTNLWKAARTYAALKGGQEVRGEELTNLMGCLAADVMNRGIKTNRKRTVDRDIGPMVRTDVFRILPLNYFKEAFWNFDIPPEKLFSLSGTAGNFIHLHGPEITDQKPRVILGTVHSVKGGEADHVWVDTETAPNIMRAIRGDERYFFDEVRVNYVACTRARETLGLILGKGNNGGWV